MKIMSDEKKKDMTIHEIEVKPITNQKTGVMKAYEECFKDFLFLNYQLNKETALDLAGRELDHKHTQTIT